MEKLELCLVVDDSNDRVSQWKSVGETVMYPCDQWLSRSNDDGEIVRELVPDVVEGALKCKDFSVCLSKYELLYVKVCCTLFHCINFYFNFYEIG